MTALEFGGALDLALNGRTPDDDDAPHCADTACWCQRCPDEPDYEAQADDRGWR